jgi:CheY-like chemotaxis protein
MELALMTDQPGAQPGTDEPQRPPRDTDKPSTGKLKPSASKLKPSTGKLIVVIENDKLVREATAGLLRSWGYRVVAAKSGGAALASLANRPPDLIISDYLSDGLTGIENIELLRRSFGAPIRALVISGETLERVPELRASGHQVLYKPVSPADLRTAIEQLLGS